MVNNVSSLDNSSNIAFVFFNFIWPVLKDFYKVPNRIENVGLYNIQYIAETILVSFRKRKYGEKNKKMSLLFISLP